MLTACTSIVLFYNGYAIVSGFEGIAFGILAFFLLCFSVLGSIIATKSIRTKQA
ncbi:hypothetical protein [Peribacillus kribbensis]|uniref:hypothetical protein n=1 Tax=Peribacillus kribbensis TaxID=356658 RepID=UPI0012DD568F